MLNVDVSATHKLTLDDISGLYSMQSSLGVEVINKSIEKVTITNVKIVSSSDLSNLFHILLHFLSMGSRYLSLKIFIFVLLQTLSC